MFGIVIKVTLFVTIPCHCKYLQQSHNKNTIYKKCVSPQRRQYLFPQILSEHLKLLDASLAASLLTSSGTFSYTLSKSVPHPQLFMQLSTKIISLFQNKSRLTMDTLPCAQPETGLAGVSAITPTLGLVFADEAIFP